MDRWSSYSVLDEAGKIILDQEVPTTREEIKPTFGKIPRSLIAMETGTHSPRVSGLLTELGYEVIVAHAQKVQLIIKGNGKDDRRDARTLARLTEGAVSARTAVVNAARGLAKSYGERLPICKSQQVSRELAVELSMELREGLEPRLAEIESLNERIRNTRSGWRKSPRRTTRSSSNRR